MSTIRFVPAANWTKKLVDFIHESDDGDEIVCNSDAERKMGKRALQRLYPTRRITFSVITAEEWAMPLTAEELGA